jgi:hypothetical protein
MEKNIETVLESSKEVCLEVNREDTKYMFMSRHQNARQKRSLLTAKKSFENVEKFKCLEMTVTNQNCIHEEIKSRLNSGNVCHHSVQNLLSSGLLSRNFEIKIYRIKILPTVLYGRETWSLTLREEHRLRVFENRVLRRIFGPKREEVAGGWRRLHNEELHDLYEGVSKSFRTESITK